MRSLFLDHLEVAPSTTKTLAKTNHHQLQQPTRSLQPLHPDAIRHATVNHPSGMHPLEGGGIVRYRLTPLNHCVGLFYRYDCLYGM